LKKPTVDYTGFRLSRIKEPRFRHLLLLVSWPIYLVLYFALERAFPLDQCYSVHCALDDAMAFNEVFVVPYVGWYFLLAFTVLYFMFYDLENFKGFQIFLIVTEVVALTTYAIFPTRVDFQPETMPRDNIFSDIIGLLYAVDVNTNACPSLHVAFSLGIGSAWSKRKQTRLWVKLMIWAMAILICLSTVYTKQHSVLDFVWALPMCLLAEIVAYGRSYWLPKFKKQPAASLNK